MCDFKQFVPRKYEAPVYMKKAVLQVRWAVDKDRQFFNLDLYTNIVCTKGETLFESLVGHCKLRATIL